MLIRSMLMEDIEAVYQIECESFSIPWSKASLEQEVNNLSAFYCVVVLDQKIVAYAGLRIVLGEGEVTNIAVSKDYRGIGIGKILLRHLLSEAAKKLVHTITLEVRAGNEAAQNLYQSYGFRAIALRKNYYQIPTEDAIIMQLQL
ncbi:ribosomal protein S18-alanine N-acetyltransferase [Cellulosilyticum sp. I15G10I2]|uniref:ribosomal protein S18-alanine N-acetyltransferase n=1 Tax=Cellulosilyticum sp. I15G10I2 TaxID=1892843 RepID=UPI00085BE627|nr:ribosomal protein S18-alanine N-acetyltransferase [Cellulosilyticum sp. I15G10I2]